MTWRPAFFPVLTVTPDGTRVARTVQRLDDGEVSPYLGCR